MKRFFVVSVLFLFSVFSAKSQTALGDSLYLIGDYTKAINAYAKSGGKNSSLQIARAYATMGNTEKAITEYEGLLQRFGNDPLAKFELGKLYDKTKNYEAAQKVFETLTKSENKNPEFYYYLGKVLQSQLDYEKGNMVLQEAIKIDSTHLRSIYLLGKYYVGVEEFDNASNYIDLGLQSAPNDVALINLKALNFFNRGLFKEAALFFERLVQLGEKKPFVYKKLGFSYARNWNFEGAKNAYRKLSEMTNYEADAYKGLGEVFLKEEQLDSAAIYFKKSIKERRYVFDEEYQSLGRIARLKNELKKSLEYYIKAWEENKTNQFNYWQVCILADEYYKDPKTKLSYYEKLLSDFKGLMPFIEERAQKRIRELKQEIHFAKE